VLPPNFFIYYLPFHVQLLFVPLQFSLTFRFY